MGGWRVVSEMSAYVNHMYIQPPLANPKLSRVKNSKAIKRDTYHHNTFLSEFIEASIIRNYNLLHLLPETIKFYTGSRTRVTLPPPFTKGATLDKIKLIEALSVFAITLPQHSIFMTYICTLFQLCNGLIRSPICFDVNPLSNTKFVELPFLELRINVRFVSIS